MRRHLSARNAISCPVRPLVAMRIVPMPIVATKFEWVVRPCSGPVRVSSCWSSLGPFFKSADWQRKNGTTEHCCKMSFYKAVMVLIILPLIVPLIITASGEFVFFVKFKPGQARVSNSHHSALGLIFRSFFFFHSAQTVAR